MKNIIISITTMCSLFCLQGLGQISSPTTDKAKNNFTFRMNNHISKCLDDPEKMANVTTTFGHTCDKNHTVTPEEIKATAVEAEKHAFIQSNMDEYMNIFFPEKIQASLNTTVEICDNGGYEQDFLHYNGFVSTYTSGSSTCTPNVAGWTPTAMPLANRFEIMSAGTDPLVGIQKVKFGNKSLRINNRTGHITSCDGNRGIDRVTKSFLVTEANRQFTVWYAVALENPTNPPHVNEQPFLNIKCDKAPADELCFDADFLKCAQNYSDPCNFDKIDVVDWACHRFNIPASEVGNIATVEMIVADCGLSAHFGYAYIDGFCEPCTGSSLGSIQLNGSPTDPTIGIDYYSCSGTTARVCGSYTLPTLCGTWSVRNINVPGYTYSNLTIDEVNKTFCFDFPISNFGANQCLDINALISFNSSLGMNLPPQPSNTIKICKNLYKSYNYSVVVGSCNSNGTPDFLSDDYYYITINISAPNGAPWSIQRKTSQYPGESGLYTITNGNGDDIITLGPFLIQEGCWDIIINLPNCNFNQKICPPPFCSGCEAFAGVQITNVKCIKGPPDTWTFDIFVPGTGTYTINGITKTKGTTHTISAGNINQSCIEYELSTFSNNSTCNQNMIICPPVPCSVENCNIEVYPGKITCTPTGYVVKLNTTPSNLCYKLPGGIVSVPIPANGEIGPLSGGNEVMISPAPCGSNPSCFKMIYLPKPNCNDPNIEVSQGRAKISAIDFNIKIVPNPFSNNQLTLKSDSTIDHDVMFSIYNNNGQMIQSGKFNGHDHTVPFDQPSGLYIIKFKDHTGNVQNYKFIKL